MTAPKRISIEFFTSLYKKSSKIYNERKNILIINTRKKGFIFPYLLVSYIFSKKVKFLNNFF